MQIFESVVAATAPARKIVTLLLGVILLTGTITSFYQSSSSLSTSFITNAQAQSIDKLLEDIDCDNINLNGNDISIDALPQSLSGLADLIQSESEDNSISNGEQRAIKDFIFKCINNNNNEFSETQTPLPVEEEGATLSINKEWFVCNNDDIDCIIEPQEEGEQITFEGANTGNYIECTSDGQCPFANDAGFNIEVTGNSPTPNTIPAQVNTEQQIQIGAGPYEVSEELFSNILVPNAVFEVDNVPVGDIQPFSPIFVITVDEAGQRVFTANTGSDSVSIIDLADNSVTNIDLFASGGDNPLAIAFDEAGQRVFTANSASASVSIIDLTNPDPNTAVTNVPLDGGNDPVAIAFDEAGQRVFTANQVSSSVSIIDLRDNSVITVPLGGGTVPTMIIFDSEGQRVFTANTGSSSVSIIDLRDNSVITVPLGGVTVPISIAFDETGQRVFTANSFSNSVSIIEFPTINRICQNSGFDTGDIRTFVSGQQTLEQITCVNFVGQCSGNIDNGETRECTVEDYIVSLDEVSNNGDGIGILSNLNNSQQQNQLFTNDISKTENKIQTQSLPTGPFVYDVPNH